MGWTDTPKPPAPPASWQQPAAHPRRAPAPRRPRVVETSQRGYFARHWHGEMSLVRAYWVNNLLVAMPLAMALTGLMSWISAKGESLQVSAIALLLVLPLLLGLDVWCIVGAWRSANNYLRENGSRLWGYLARITLALGALQLLVSVLFGLLPSLGGYWQMARGIDPIGHAKFSLSPDGRSLRLDGTIGMGDASRLRALLDSEAARGLRRIELVSPGGRLHEAELMAAALKPRGHEVRVVGDCASACTVVFLAGQPRQLTPGARLGFHRATTGTYNPVFEELANQQLAATYRDLGLPQPLIDRTLDTPSRSMWFAPREDLLAHALIAPMPQTLAIALPPAGKSGLPDFDDALRIHPVWDALEQHTPGTIDAVAKRMWDARSAGAADEDVQGAALPHLARQMPTLIAGSDAASRRRYVQLVADQLRALQAAPRTGTRPACRDLLDGRLDVRRQLPLGLQIRESQWLLDAASGPPPRWLPKPPSALEIEVLNRSVGTAALGMLSRLWADAPDGAASGPACEPVIALLDRLAAQPPARRELAERLLFQPRP
jgi:plasmid stabilization system protein ParE